jgi:FlaA1/EpsC-like NDP-sugar epimerase
VIIYGAGEAGHQLLVSNDGVPVNIVAIVDDDDDVRHARKSVDDTQVINRDELESVIKKENVSELWIALPAATAEQKIQIIQYTASLDVVIKTLPDVRFIKNCIVNRALLADVQYDDLLVRPANVADTKLLENEYFGKTIFITGAAGSIGSQICRELLPLKPKTIVLIDTNEFHLYKLGEELDALKVDNTFLRLVNVLDESFLKSLFEEFSPSVVFHVAAYKHVPLLEKNVLSAIRNNVFGTLSVLRCVEQFKVNKFVFVSTDKAVRPSSVMGATKRIGEMLVQFNQTYDSDTVYSVVRFGNVLGSNGSVVPKFMSQIKAGGPVTVTDPRATRYFMKLDEAANLVMQVGALSTDGGIYVLDMGQPVNIAELSKRIILLTGNKVFDEVRCKNGIKIKFIGLRVGEKLHEELWIDGQASPTSNPKILRSAESMDLQPDFVEKINKLEKLLHKSDVEKARMLLAQIVTANDDVQSLN